jgi:hypothetical protein
MMAASAGESVRGSCRSNEWVLWVIAKGRTRGGIVEHPVETVTLHWIAEPFRRGGVGAELYSSLGVFASKNTGLPKLFC